MEKNNDVIYQIGLHWIIFLWPVVMGFVAIFAFIEFSSLREVSYLLFFFSIAWGVMQWVMFQFSSITVKKGSVVFRTGLLVRQTLDIPMSKIESIDVRQSILGSMLGYGSLLISGTGGTRNMIHEIQHPLTCRRHIEQSMQESE